MVANGNTDVFPLCITQLSLIVVLYHRYHSRTVDQKKPVIALSHSEDISFWRIGKYRPLIVFVRDFVIVYKLNDQIYQVVFWCLSVGYLLLAEYFRKVDLITSKKKLFGFTNWLVKHLKILESKPYNGSKCKVITTDIVDWNWKLLSKVYHLFVIFINRDCTSFGRIPLQVRTE